MLQNLQHVQGDDAYYDIPVVIDGVAPDITGWLFWITVKVSPDDADLAAVFQLSSAGGDITLFNAAGGIARAHIQPAHTKTKAPGRYFCDVQAKQPNGDINTIDRCFFTILPEITRA